MIVKNGRAISLGGFNRRISLIRPKSHFQNVPPYQGRVLSLDAVPYDIIPNQITFTNAGVPTADGTYVYTQTGAPHMFSATGFVGPLTYATQYNDYRNNFVQFDTVNGKTGYFLGEWHEDNWTYFNAGNISFVNRVEVTNADFNLNDTYIRVNSGDNIFSPISQENRKIIKNQNSGWNLRDDDDIVRYTNDDINLDPNGWYYNYTNTINLSGFYGYEDGTAYTNEITISGAGTFDDTYRRQFNDESPLESATINDDGEYYIPFADTTFISEVELSSSNSPMDGTYTRGEGSAGYEGTFTKTDDPNFTMYWDTDKWVIEGPTFYCSPIDSNVSFYAWNSSPDMSANWQTSDVIGCDREVPVGTVTVSTISDINYKGGLKTIQNKGALPLSYGTSMDPFFGWYLYDPMLPDAEFPRYGIHTDDTTPTTLPAYTSVKSFRVSGLANVADNGVYSRDAGLNTPFTKAGSNPIIYEDYTVSNDPGWKTWIDVNEQETATHKLSNSAEITTGGWQRGFVDKIVFSGANNIANGTYVFQNQYDNEEENLRPVLTILGSGGTSEPRGWRIFSPDDNQTDALFLQSPPQTTWWNGDNAPVWYLQEEFENPRGLGTVMTSSDRGLTWTSPYTYQFNLGGLPAPHTAYNKTYTFTSAASKINDGNGGIIDTHRIYYGDNMFYDITSNTWLLQFDYSYQDQNDDHQYKLISLQKTGPSPVGTWTSTLNGLDYLEDFANGGAIIIGGTIVGSNAIAISPGSGTLPTLSISEIEYVSGDGNYSNPTLTSQISGNIISVDGTYTRNQAGTTSLSNGNSTMFFEDDHWILEASNVLGNFSNYDFNLAENSWSPSNQLLLVEGTASNTTAKYYLANKTDGLLGIQYSGYFDGDPTWFNTASVKPIINELTLAGASEGATAGTYTRVGDQNNQGTSYFQGPNGWMISYYGQFPANESYWFLHPGDYNQYYTSNDLTTWATGPEGDTPPTATITQTQNSENSTNFGTTRALSNDTSWQWVGYFRANDTSNHNFYLNADEDAYFWIGDKGSNGYTNGNADIYSTANNGSSIINLPLTSGTYYPVRMQWGHPGNPTYAGLSLSYRNGAQGITYDFSGLFFNFTGDGIATNSNDHVYDFTLGEWQSTTIAQPSLLLHMNGTNGSANFVDSSPNDFNITVNENAQISTDQSKFGGASAYFDGSSSINIPTSLTQFNAGQNFTVECWLNLSSYGNGQIGIIGADTFGTFNITVNSIGSQAKKVSVSRSNQVEMIHGSTTINLNQWYHIAVARDNGIIKLFTNGQLDGSYTDNTIFSAPDELQIGHLANEYGWWFNGYIDELRIIKGHAAHKSNFTPQTQPFTLSSYDPAPNAVYSHVWLDSISGFNNGGAMYTGNKHVTLVNDPVYSSDFDGIYSFNGIDQYAMTQEVPQSTDGSVSHFTWFKPTGAGVVVDELGQPGLFGGWHDTQLEVMQDGKVNFGIWGDYRTDSTLKIRSTGSIDFDRWYHLGLTYSSGVLSAYINGEKIADSNCPSRSAPSGFYSLYYAICGGDSTNMGEGGFGKGSVGSFQVYNKGLTQTEVANLYSGEKDRFDFSLFMEIP